TIALHYVLDTPADVPHQLVGRRVQHVVQGDGQLHHPQAGGQVAAGAGDGVDDQRPLPRFPKSIGIVTSPTGAAVRDIVKVARRRWPGIELVLFPVQVQGVGAAAQIADAIAAFNEYGQVDLMIVGRGGGSIEDLWAFNEEVTARAIYNSKIPIVSAVGHEVDYTIADYTADLRAPTPSAAAEICLPDAREVAAQLDDSRARLANALVSLADGYGERLRSLRKSYGMGRLADLCGRKQQQLDWLADRMARQSKAYLSDQGHRLGNLAAALRALDPENVLRRGYSICRDGQGKAITRAQRLQAGDAVIALFSEGSAELNVKKVMP
ncbi:exodeoxyribonuclease VII large subunit, partial [bacterium]|nr:exodeoxyribonuclease VII large subunit [bacterium]